MLDDNRVKEPPFILRATKSSQAPKKLIDFVRIVVAVDPAVTATRGSDYTAIVVAGLGNDGFYYVLDAGQFKLSPGAWGQRVLDYYKKWQADAVVGEVNNGGDLVRANIMGVAQAQGITVRFIEVRASRGKSVRAEPIVGLYEQGKVRHVGMLADLEDQMCEFPVANENDDLVDAGVYALTELSGVTPLEVRFM
jgi:predicted phage terminase large subunit-like protein